MIPILYKKDEQQFRSYGLGELSSFIETPEVYRERNGQYYFYMKYALDGELSDQLEEGMKIKSDAGSRTKWQTFEVNRIVKESGSYIEVYAKHISMRTAKDVLRPRVSGNNLNGQQLLNLWNNNLVGDNHWDVWSDVSTQVSVNWNIEDYDNAREVLGGREGSILDRIGGEYEFDNKTIRLWSQMGRTAPTVLEYGRNIVSVEKENQEDSVYTSVYPFATYTPEGQDTIAMVTLPEFYVDSDYIGMYDHRKIQLVDFTTEFDSDNTPTPAALRVMASQYIENNEIGSPWENIKVRYQDLSKTLDYEDFQVMEEVELNDVVPVFYPKFKIMNNNAKVVVTIYDPVKEEYKSIELGVIGQRFGTVINQGVNQRLDRVEKEQRQQHIYIVNAAGNRIWYSTPPEDVEHKIGDLWFEQNGQYMRMRIWNGSQWIVGIDTEDIDKNAKAIEQALADAEQDRINTEAAIEQALADAKAHADTEVERIDAELTTEIGGAIDLAEQAKADAITEANQALEDAKAHAEAEDARIRGELELEVGGAIDLAEQARQDAIDKADQALADAKAHADAEIQASNEAFDAQFVIIGEEVADAQSSADTANQQINDAVTNAGFSSLTDLTLDLQTIGNQAEANAQTALSRAADAQRLADTTNQKINDAVSNAGFDTLDETITFMNQLSNDAEANANQAISDAGNAYNLAQTSISEAQTAQANSLTALGKADNALVGVSGLDVRVDDVEAEVALKADNTYMTEDGELITLSNAITLNAHRFSSDMQRIESRVESVAGEINLIILRDAFVDTRLLGRESYPNPTPRDGSSTMREMIAVTEGEQLALTKIATEHDNYWRISFFDGSLEYVTRSTPDENEVILTVPNSVAYMWVSYPTGSQPQITRGTQFVPYRPNMADQMTTDEVVIFRNEYDEFADRTERRLTAVDSSGGRLETAELLISQTANGLELKADQTQVNELEGTLNNLGTEFEVVAGQVSSRVWETDIKSAVDEIDIGGRNLLKNSDFKQGFGAGGWSSWSSPSNAFSTFVTPNSSRFDTALKITNTGGTSNYIYHDLESSFDKGDQVTVSFYALGPGDIIGVRLGQHGANAQDVTSSRSFNTGGSWKRYEFTATIDRDTDSLDFYGLRFTFSQGQHWITHLMLEKGNKASDWRPAPEDTMEAISHVESEWKQTAQGFEQSITRVETGLDGKANLVAFNTLESTVDGLKSEVGSYEQTVDGYSAQVSSFENTVNGLNNTVSDYQSDVQGYSAQVSTLTNTVNGFNATVESVEADYSDLSGTVQSLGASIGVVEGQITNRVWQTDIQSAVDGISVGGRNLIRRNDEISGFILSTGVGIGANPLLRTSIHSIDVEPDTEYVLSGNAYEIWRFAWEDESGNLILHQGADTRPNIPYRVITSPIDAKKLRVSYPNGTHMKLEKGNKATDWSPAPEDTMEVISHVESELTQKSDTITASVDSLDGRVVQQQLSIDGIESTIQATQEDLEGAKTLLNTTKSTVDGHVSTIATLRTDVDGKATVTAFNTLESTVDGTVQRIGDAEGNITQIEENVNGMQTTVASKASQTEVTQLADGFNVLSRSVVKNLVPLTSDGYVDWSTFAIGNDIGSTSISGRELTVRMDTSGAPGAGNRIMLSSSLFETPGKFNIRIRIRGSHGTAANQQIAVGQGGYWSELINITNTDRWYELVYEAPSPTLTLGIAFVRGTVSPTWFNISGLEIVPTGAVSESQLSALSDAINLRVVKGDVMSQINIEAEQTLIQSNRLVLDANSVLFTGSAFIPSAQIQSLHASKITAGTISTARLNATEIVAQGLTANVIESTHLETSTATIDKLFATDAMVNTLTAKTAFITSIRAVTIDASRITSGIINSARINSSQIVTQGLTANVIESTHLETSTATIDKLFATDAMVNTLTAKTAFIASIKAVDIDASKITSGTINTARLNATEIITEGLVANVINATHILADAAIIDKLFATEANIDVLTSKTAFIDSIKAVNIDASRITSGTINSARIDAKFIVTEGLDVDIIEADYIKADFAIIDKLFATEALIDRLVSKEAFIEDIQAIEISADNITAGTLNASYVNLINVNVDNLVGNTSGFIQSAWNGIGRQITISAENGIQSIGTNGDAVRFTNGEIEFQRGAQGRHLLYNPEGLILTPFTTNTGTSMNTSLHLRTIVNAAENYIHFEDPQFSHRIRQISSILNIDHSNSGELRIRDRSGNDGIIRARILSTRNGSDTVGNRIMMIGDRLQTPRDGLRDIYISPNGQGKVRVANVDRDYYAIRAIDFENASSRELKTNIEDFTGNALSVVNSLNVVEYEMKRNIREGVYDRQLGLISEDSPAVASMDGESILSYKVDAYLIKSVQELSSQHENLLKVATHGYLLAEQHEDELEQLRKENKKLTKRVEALEGAA